MELVAKYFNYGLRRPVCQKWVQANKVQVRNARSVPTRNLPTPKTERRLDVVILGYPNAGKSVLLNTLVEAKLAATTRKRHTTRSQILGVFNHKNVQLAFYDTPGFIRNSDATQNAVKQLRNIAAAATLNADVVLLVVDSSVNSSLSNVKDTFAEMVQIASDNPKTELILVLNKIDLVIPKTKLLDLVFDYVSLINGVKLGPEGAKKAKLDTTTFMVSGQDNDGVIDLKNYLIASAKSKKWIIGKEKDTTKSKLTNLSDEERVQEVVLEMLLENTHEEIPYIAEIDCISIKKIASGMTRIDVDIILDTKRQQKIVVGHQGRTLLKIRAASCKVLESIFENEVLLFLQIVVRDPDAEEAEEE